MSEELKELETEFIEENSEQAERDFVNNLGEDEQEFNPDQAVSDAASKPSAKEEIASLTQDASMLVGGADYLLRQALHPAVGFDDGTKESLSLALAPLLKKYGGEMPPWLKPYKEELTFGIALAGAGMGVFMQYQAIKKLEAAQNQPESESEPEAVNAAD